MRRKKKGGGGEGECSQSFPWALRGPHRRSTWGTRTQCFLGCGGAGPRGGGSRGDGGASTCGSWSAHKVQGMGFVFAFAFVFVLVLARYKILKLKSTVPCVCSIFSSGLRVCLKDLVEWPPPAFGKMIIVLSMVEPMGYHVVTQPECLTSLWTQESWFQLHHYVPVGRSTS